MIFHLLLKLAYSTNSCDRELDWLGKCTIALHFTILEKNKNASVFCEQYGFPNLINKEL